MKIHLKQTIWSVSLLLAIAAVGVLPLMPLGPAAPAFADGPNLLRNPSFEGRDDWRSTTSTSSVAKEWNPWWRSKAANETAPFAGYLYEPQYTRTFGDPFPISHEGVGTQKLHTFSATHDGGIWQRISGLTPGTTYTFSIWAWGLTRNSDGNTSDGPNMEKRVGIDPTGQDPFSSSVMPPANVVWSGSDYSNDGWVKLSVSATATGDSVVVYTRSTPKFPVRWNATWWDDASLTSSAPPAPVATATPSAVPTVALPPAAAEPQDERYFFQTGYRIGDDRIWDYFNKRGGLRTFGYPTSRKFRLLGRDVQFFQRRVVQVDAAGNVGQLNLLDQDVMPYNTMNGATFPKFDAGLVAALPPVGSPGYDTAVADYIKAKAPDSWNNMDVNFLKTFNDSVKMEDAFPEGNGSDGVLFGFDVEMWGVPTSAPAVDPSNFNFVYLRFQRGIMHYSKDNGATQGLLMGDYFKAIITGRNLPPDLDAQAAGSRFYKQYLRGAPSSLARPGELPDTDMSDAFEAGPTR
ncbi:MAG: hypothetical protein M1531_11560 [Chloroflexi bacterium]|nr:hypothetical protein [Chloroflexota bacterium]